MAVRKQPNLSMGSGLRVVLYLRVSSEEQVQGYSLDAQERAGRAWCDQHGAQLVGIYTDEGRSARSDDIAKRPDFKRLLADVEAGLAEVVVVHKLDRFARNRSIAFEAINRLGSAGVGFVSIAENMDYSTPAGLLMLTMLVGLAQFYSDNLSFETSKGKQERKRQGLYNGLLPFGTTKGPDGVPVRDTVARCCNLATRTEVTPADGLRLAFELAANGKTDREIAQALNAAGHRTTGNRGANPFTKDSVRVILQNRFYLGELPEGEGGSLPAKHGSLIDSAIFAAARASREGNTRRAREVSTVRSPWALSGLAVCGGCGASMNVTHHMTGKRRIRCAGRAQGSECQEPSCFASVIEDQIGALLAAFAVPATDQTRLLHLWRAYQSSHVDTAATRITIRRKLDRLKELYLDGDLDKASYQDRKASLTAELAALPAEGDPNNDAGARLAAYLADLSRAWTIATPEERNRMARQLFHGVVVKNKTAVAVVPRPDLRPFFRLVAVNPDGKECIGGSDGDRSRRTDRFPTMRSSSQRFRPPSRAIRNHVLPSFLRVKWMR